MGGYFRGWRRKLGVATLLLACAFSVAWVRSLHSREFLFIEFEFPFGGRINAYTSSNQADVLLQRSTGWRFDFGEVDPIITSDALENAWLFDIRQIDEEIVDGVQTIAAGYGVKIYFSVIVIPLTALSAYLILRRPRRTEQTGSTDTTSTSKKSA